MGQCVVNLCTQVSMNCKWCEGCALFYRVPFVSKLVQLETFMYSARYKHTPKDIYRSAVVSVNIP